MFRAQSSKSNLVMLFAVTCFGVLVGTGCASTAQYPVRTLDDGDVVASGSMHGSTYGAIPALSGQVRYGLDNKADIGGHASVEGYTMKDLSFGPGGLAFGGSYRHYLARWFRVGIESTFHHTAEPFDGGYFDEDAMEFGGPSLVTQAEYVDDWLSTRAVFQLAKSWHRVGVHGGPILKTGLWIPDGERPEVNPRTGREVRPRWMGVQLGAFAGMSLYSTNGVSIQFDGQLMPAHVGDFTTGDYSSASYVGSNVIRFTISGNYRF